MIFIKAFQKLSQFSGKVPLEHWVSRIAVNTCLNQIQWEKIRPELRHADLSVEEQAVIENLQPPPMSWHRTSVSPRANWLNIFSALKLVERLAIDLLYLQDARLKRSVNSPAGAQRLLKYGRFGATKNERVLARISAKEGK